MKNVTENTASFHRRNHYVPQSYLKQWSEKDSQLWVYRLLTSHSNVPLWRKASIKGIGYHAFLYSRIAAGGLTDELEQWLASEFESPAEEIIQKVITGASLKPDDWSHLIRFLAAQDVRTPARLFNSLQRWNLELPDLLNNVLVKAVHDLEASKREGKSISDIRPDLPFPSSEANALPVKISTELVPGEDHGKLRAEMLVGRSLWQFSLKQLLTSTLNVLIKHKWTILRSPTGFNWLTSDDPVVRLNYYNSKEYDFGGGWDKKGTEIFLPLSPQHMLYTQVGSKVPKRGTIVSRSVAEHLQRFTIEHAHRYIFSIYQDQSVSSIRPRLVDKTIYEEEFSHWKRWHHEQTEAEIAMRN